MVELLYDYSILIPSWKNKPYLQNCIEGIIKNSRLNFEIIVFLNEDCPDSRMWLESLADKRIQILSDNENIGICLALNKARSYIRSEYILYMNDDMYPLENWDTAMMERMKLLENQAYISATMVEPKETGNSCVLVADFGDSLENFRKEDLEKSVDSLHRADWQGATWPPSLLHVSLWDAVGGMSIEYSPGYYSDPDLSMKLYQAGLREFIGLGSSLVYHFGKKTTSKIPNASGKSKFLYKWGMSVSQFYKTILLLGQPYTGALKSNKKIKKSLAQSLKKIWYSFRI